MIIKPSIDLDGSSKNQRIFFMGDLHYGHSNVIRFDNRPFSTTEEMNQYIETVLKTYLTKDDIVFDLGDMFSKSRDNEIKQVLDQISTKKLYKIIGNHDKPNLYRNILKSQGYFVEVADLFDLNIRYNNEPIKIILSHYPILSWQCKSHGSIHLHAHCHGNLDDFNSASTDLRVDIGFNSKLTKEVGCEFLVEIRDVISYFKKYKTNGLTFRDYMKDEVNRKII